MSSPRKARSGWAVSPGAVLGLALLATLICHRPESHRQQLLATSGPCRPTPGRLAGEEQYRPWRKDLCDTPVRRDLSDLARVTSARRRGEPGRELLDRALLHVLDRKTSRAIASLRLAIQKPETAIAALTDLSAVYLLRFESESDPLDLLRAVQAAERGLALDPAHPSLLFNRAQALSWLGTRRLAKRAWQEVREKEVSTGWQEEADSNLRELGRPSDEEVWERSRSMIESPAATSAQIGALVERLPANARSYAEEVLLPRWAAAISRGDSVQSERSLRLATMIGEILARSRGEKLLADTISVMRKTMERGSSSQRQALLRGLEDFGVGVAEYHEQNLTSAREPLVRAERDLASVGCPLRFWARFYLSIGEYYSDADRGLAILDSLLAEVPQDRYPALTGRIEWIAGTIDKVQGRIESSIRRYNHAAASLRRAGGDRASAFVSVLLAEVYSLYGEHALGWQQRLLAFHRVRYSEGLRRNVAMWIEAKEALLRQGRLDLAGPLVEEAVAEAESWGRPLGRATAYPERAAYLLTAGKPQEALADLRKAQQALSQMEDSPLKDQLSVSTQIAEGLYYRATEPARAAVLLEEALESQRATGNQFESITYTTAKATAQLAAGQVEAGAESLEAAISIFESIRATVEDPVSRMQAFRQAQPAFDELIRLRTTVLSGDREAPFRLSERSRARVLLELRTRNDDLGQGGQEFVRLAELEKMLPSGTALVSYAVLEDRVLAWVVDEGSARLVTLAVQRKEIAEAIERFRLEMERGAEEALLRAASAPLYDLLIRPLGLVPSDGPLILVPDRWLTRLPFAALFDRPAGRYLVEERVVTMVPSATLLVRGSGEHQQTRARDLSALAVGVSRQGLFSGRLLPRLRYADQEAQEVAAVYANNTALINQQATQENFVLLSVSKDVIHFAGHAVVDLEAPRRSVLLFAGRSPQELEPLSLGELFDAGLGSARLVVLSACRAQDSLADDREGLLGLAGAFFAAGVPEIVASPWDVEDRASLRVMAAFHREYWQHRSAGVAFREAVRSLLRSSDPEERSPAAWGGFTVIEGFFHKEGK